MPIMTRLVISRSSAGGRPLAQGIARQHDLADDFRRRLRLRTRRWVPVWQKRQVSVQPTWLETQSVPRSVSGIWTLSTSWPSVKRSSHFWVPSLDCCAVAISWPADLEVLRQADPEGLGERSHGLEVRGATVVDPMPGQSWRARKAGSPRSTMAWVSSSRLRPIRVLRPLSGSAGGAKCSA